MKLKLTNELIFRVPQFPMDAQLEQEWEVLKESIALSSSDFYEQIKDTKAHELKMLPRPIYHTIWKYFNRSKYRATPYGSFAGCGYTSFQKPGDETFAGILIDNRQHLHRYSCWSGIGKIETAQGNITENTFLIANSSYYSVGNNIRYLIKEDGNFHLAEIESEDIFKLVLLNSALPVRAIQLIDQCGTTLSILQGMVNLQLLLSEATPNIIGSDYFKRMGIGQEEGKQYVLAERKAISAQIGDSLFKYLPGYIALMSQIVPQPEAKELSNFKQRFARKFEGSAVPLMVALDPELGVGFANLGIPTGIDMLIESNEETNSSSSGWLNTMMFRSLSHCKEKCINIETVFPEFKDKIADTVPNALGLLCTVIDRQIFIEQASPPTVNRIAGRFTLMGSEIKNFCTRSADFEALANPDILFFDIAYTDELDIDNVNRREQIYPYTLSILNFDTSEQPLSLTDIMVVLNGDELILFSVKHQRRVVPRQASGYNHLRSNLAVYRLLCELQYQGITANLDLKLHKVFPKEKHYPRLQYQNIIVSPEQWRMGKKDVELHTGTTMSKTSLKQFIKEIGLPQCFLTRTEDRTMFFDSSDEGDMVELLHLFNKFESFLLEEGFVAQKQLVRDINGKGYSSQVLLTLTHDQAIYTPFSKLSVGNLRAVKFFPPGSEWLYMELYLHPNRADSILVEIISEYVERFRKNISKWFYVRFDTGGNHLRLRFQIKNDQKRTHLTHVLIEMLKGHMTSNILSDIKIGTYKPEVERYGEDLIEQVEQHFTCESYYVLDLIKLDLSSEIKYKLVMEFILNLRKKCFDKIQEIDFIIHHICKSFSKEKKITGEGFKNLNTIYKKIKGENLPAFMGTIASLQEAHLSSAQNLIINCPKDRRVKLYADLVHMFVNKLFSMEQRNHEHLIYYCTEREINRRYALGIDYCEEAVRA